MGQAEPRADPNLQHRTRARTRFFRKTLVGLSQDVSVNPVVDGRPSPIDAALGLGSSGIRDHSGDVIP